MQRVLVVDDLDAVREIVRAILERSGFSVLTARDGIEAVNVVERTAENIDLLITDVELPSMNGYILAEHLKALRPELAIIVTSASLGYRTDKKKAAELGGAFLPKPFTPQELLSKIDELIENQAKT